MKYKLNILLLFTLFQSSAQNLVPNPSFEIYSTCPNDLNQVGYATGWSSYGNTPDYYNACYINGPTWVDVPYNYNSFQFAADGDAYCGLISWLGDNSNYRELIGTQLITPLDSGITYYVSMKLNFPFRYHAEYCWNTAIKNMGIRFTNTQYSQFSPHPTDNLCHVCADQFIDDTLNWQQICRPFTPDQSYQYMVIGNFFTDIDTETTMIFPTTSCGNCSSYLVDDIIVSTDSTICNLEPVGIIELSNQEKILIKIVDSMGRETEDKPNTLLFYIYSDGTTEKVFRVE